MDVSLRYIWCVCDLSDTKLDHGWSSIFLRGFRMGKGCGHRNEHCQVHGFR